MASPDWANRPEMYVIHFSSYRERVKAAAQAAELTRQLGRPAYVAQVNLGAEGTWYRVVVGDFPTADAALAVRDQLAAQKVPDLAHVYHAVKP
jgi:cell division protein FtsN